MDTKQKTRRAPSGTGKQPAGKNTRKKKNPGLLGLLGTGSAAKKSAPAPRPRPAARPREVMPEQQTAVPESAIPEMVFKPGEQENQTRIRTPEENKRAEVRRRSARRAKEREEEAQKAKKRPNVTYTDPVPFNLQRLLLQLTAVVAMVLAVVMGLSVFFKVKHVVVYGNHAYSAWTIQEASGIEGGENLLTFGSTRACGKITTALPYVNTVRIGIKLPDTVNIYVEEFDVVYAIEARDSTGTNSWWLMTSGGKMVEKIDSGIANDYTKVQGVKIDSPQVGADAKAVEDLIPVTQETSAAGETQEEEFVYSVTGSDRLKAALLILEALELNDIVGEASSINVENLTDLELMYGQRFHVKLGDTQRMDYKIACMKQAVAQQNDYQTGILDVSFTSFGEQVGFTPNA